MEADTCKKEVVIEIPLEVVQRESENVTAQYARQARLPGFRPGHAPPSLVRRRFREKIRSEVVQSLLPKFFQNVVKDQKLSVVGRPHFEELKFEEDQPLTCKATFEVYPEIELKNYKGLQVEEEPGTVTEAEIDEALEELRERAATFEVVSDRPAEDDDYVIVSYQGRDLKDPRADPIEVRDGVAHLGGQGTVAAFTENLRGSKAGEEREFDVSYRDDYPQKSLAGKIMSYHVEVQSIKKKVLPAIDDELAKTLSEFTSLQELRGKLRGDLEKRRQRQVENAAKRKLIEELLKTHEFPVPEALVEVQLDRKVENTVTQLMARGIDSRSTEIDWRKAREEMRPEAEKEVRAFMILEKIAEAEKIEVSEGEVDEVIREVAQEGRETAAALKTRLTREGGLDKLQSSRRNQKALDFIYRNAIVARKMDGTEGISRVETGPSS